MVDKTILRYVTKMNFKTILTGTYPIALCIDLPKYEVDGQSQQELSIKQTQSII